MATEMESVSNWSSNILIHSTGCKTFFCAARLMHRTETVVGWYYFKGSCAVCAPQWLDCDCGLGVQDAFHFFFKCPAPDANRSHMLSRIQKIASDGEKSYAVPTSIMFVLSPGRYDNFTQEQWEDILNATFEYTLCPKKTSIFLLFK